MKLKIALAGVSLLGSPLAILSAEAQNATAVVLTKASQQKTSTKLPHRATAYLSRYRSRTEAARRAYQATLEAEQARLERALHRELMTATRRNDFGGAQAILATIKELHTSREPMSPTSSQVAYTKAQIEQALLGKWSVHCGPTFKTVWTFRPDGTVLSVNGAPEGHWQWEQVNRRILIQWNETEWDNLNGNAILIPPASAVRDTKS